MKHFWHGFRGKQASSVSFKKHVIVLFWDSDGDSVSAVKKLSFKYPSVKVKIINVRKDPTKPAKHKVHEYPTVLLLRSGREVGRVSGKSETLLEQLFRKANV